MHISLEKQKISDLYAHITKRVPVTWLLLQVTQISYKSFSPWGVSIERASLLLLSVTSIMDVMFFSK